MGQEEAPAAVALPPDASAGMPFFAAAYGHASNERQREGSPASYTFVFKMGRKTLTKFACTEAGLPSNDTAREDSMEPGLGTVTTVDAGYPIAVLNAHVPAIPVQLDEIHVDDHQEEQQPSPASDTNISPARMQFAGSASVWEASRFRGEGPENVVQLQTDRKWGHINPGEDDTSDLNLVEKGMFLHPAI